jgi:class 3 adenylate cyclase/mannose-6-phosphate isomerase-like protein (cupin superfamily)
MPHLQRKATTRPDEVREFTHGKVNVLQLGEQACARFIFQPGWVWSKDVSPIAGTASCQHRHLGFTISGTLHVRMDDGVEMTIGPGDVYEIPPGHDAWVVGDDPWDSIEFASARSFGAAPDELGRRTLATVLFSDIVDSTGKLAELGDHAWGDIVQEHNVRVRRALDQYIGREMATLGDGFLALFDGPARAVRAAILMSEAVADLGLKIRIGIHTGEVEIDGGQARGVAVHMAARVAAIAGGGQILVSSMTHDLLDGSGLEFDEHGQHELKGLRGARTLFVLKR